MKPSFLHNLMRYINEAVFLGDPTPGGAASYGGQIVSTAKPTHRRHDREHPLTVAQAAALDGLQQMLDSGESGVHLVIAPMHRVGKDTVHQCARRHADPERVLTVDSPLSLPLLKRSLSPGECVDRLYRDFSAYIDDDRHHREPRQTPPVSPQDQAILFLLDATSTKAVIDAQHYTVSEMLPLLNQALDRLAEHYGSPVIVQGNLIIPDTPVAGSLHSAKQLHENRLAAEEHTRLESLAREINLRMFPLPADIGQIRKAMWESLPTIRQHPDAEDEFSPDNPEHQHYFISGFVESFRRMLVADNANPVLTNLAEAVLNRDIEAFNALFHELCPPAPLRSNAPAPSVGKSLTDVAKPADIQAREFNDKNRQIPGQG